MFWPVIHGRNEPVAASWHRFDEPRRVGRVAERLAQAIDDGVQAVLEIDERAIWPEPLTQFLARDEIARSLQQQRRGPERTVPEG